MARRPQALPTGAMGCERIARIAMIGALYGATTLFCLLFLGNLAWGPVQFRISEALCVLALFTADAIPGLALGCAVANALNMVLGGVGVLGLLDVVFGSAATALGAWVTWRLRARPAVALLGPIVANMVIVPAYLPLMLTGLGFYTIPFTSISLDGVWPLMYLFAMVTCALGEAIVIYLLGLPLARDLEATPVPALLAAESDGQGPVQ